MAVALLDDAVDEGEETFVLEGSRPFDLGARRMLTATLEVGVRRARLRRRAPREFLARISRGSPHAEFGAEHNSPLQRSLVAPRRRVNRRRHVKHVLRASA